MIFLCLVDVAEQSQVAVARSQRICACDMVLTDLGCESVPPSRAPRERETYTCITRDNDN